MESLEKIEAAITMVKESRAVPLSASCVVHRGELLGLLDEINKRYLMILPMHRSCWLIAKR